MTVRRLPAQNRSHFQDPGVFESSPDAPEPIDEHVYELHEQIYQAHEQFEDDAKDLHDDVGDIVEQARRAEHQGEEQYYRHDQQRPGHLRFTSPVLDQGPRT